MIGGGGVALVIFLLSGAISTGTSALLGLLAVAFWGLGIRSETSYKKYQKNVRIDERLKGKYGLSHLGSLDSRKLLLKIETLERRLNNIQKRKGNL